MFHRRHPPSMNNPLQITIKCSVCMQIYLMERYSIFGQELHTWPPKFLPPFLIILPPLWSGIFRPYKHAIFFQLFLWYIWYFFLVYNCATTYHPRSITKEKRKKKTKQFDQFYCSKIKESSDRRASKLNDSNLVKLCVNLKQPDKALNLNGLVGRHC